MLLEYIARFVAGGLLVCLFSLISQVCEPKQFAGLFSAAPSVLLAGLVLTLFIKGATSLAIFIAAIPVLKMLNHPGASRLTRFAGQLLEGAAKPVGGSSEATVQLKGKPSLPARRLSLFEEACQLANQGKR